MGNIIKVKYDNKDYTLEFNRRVILKMEADGFLGKKGKELQENNPLEYAYILIGYAFVKNHPAMSQNEVADIIDQVGDFEGFVEAIAEIMKASIETFNKGEQGNAKWERA